MPPSCFSVGALFICLFLLIGPAAAIIFEFKGEHMGAFRAEGYRPIPHIRVGVYSKHSTTAKFAGRREEPFIDVDLILRNPVHGSAEAFVYRMEGVEMDALGKVEREYQNICADNGQQHGAAIWRNFSNMDAFKIAATPKQWETGALDVSGRISLSTTGLYIISFNQCRYVWQNPRTNAISTVDPGDGSVRILETSAWEQTTITGTITVRNPYGGMPGQAYGFLPCYTLFFVMQIVILIVLFVGACLVGMTRVLAYQYMLFWAAIVSCLGYMFLIMYFWILNNSDKNARWLFIIAELIIIVRAAATRFTIFMIGYGYKIWKPTLGWIGVACCIVTAIYVAIRVIFLIVSESSDTKTSSAMIVINMQPSLMENALEVLTILMEIAIAVCIGLVLLNSLRKVPKKEKTKRSVYWQTVICLAIYEVIAGLWWMWCRFSHGAGSYAEDMWEFWWMQYTGFDALFVYILWAMVIVWFPRRQNVYLEVATYNDDQTRRYAGIGLERKTSVDGQDEQPIFNRPGGKAPPPPPGQLEQNRKAAQITGGEGNVYAERGVPPPPGEKPRPYYDGAPQQGGGSIYDDNNDEHDAVEMTERRRGTGTFD